MKSVGSMNLRFWGALICMVLAVVYFFLWPGRKSQGVARHSPWFTYMILRWFHSLARVLLAASCLISAKFPAAVAAIVYLAFIITTWREHRATRC